MKVLSLILGILVCAAAGAQARWYLSDSLGTNLGEAPQGLTAAWLLRVEPFAAGEERTLFDHGREDSVRRVEFDDAHRVIRIEDLRAGLPTWEVAYDPTTDLPTQETVFEDGRPAEVSQLQFDSRVLVKRMVVSPTHETLYTDRLSRWPDGTLRRVERDGPQGPLAEAEWSYGPRGGLAGSWVVDEHARTLGQHRETTFDHGQTVEILAAGTQVVMTRVTEELKSGSRETESSPSDERVDEQTLDRQGHPLTEVVSVKGTVTQSRSWAYDKSGRLVEAVVESAGPREVWSYTYGNRGTVVGQLTRGGTLVREETLVDGIRTLVRLYDRGTLFLVETWAAGRLAKETYYQNGEVVRERTP